MSSQIKTREHCNWFTLSCRKEKKTLKEASQETEIDVKKGNCCNLIIINKLCLSVATTFIMKCSNNFVENVFRKFL